MDQVPVIKLQNLIFMHVSMLHRGFTAVLWNLWVLLMLISANIYIQSDEFEFRFWALVILL